MSPRRRPVDVALGELAAAGHSTELIETQAIRPGMTLMSPAGVIYRVVEIHRPGSGRAVVFGSTDAGSFLELQVKPSPAQYAIRVHR